MLTAPTRAAAAISAGRAYGERIASSRGEGGLARVVRDDDVGARASDGRQGFQHRAALVEPAIHGGRLEHRVLAADGIRRRRMAEGLFNALAPFQLSQRGFSHPAVDALFDVL